MHKKNAHKFVDYLLRPDVAARLTNQTGIFVNVLGIDQYLSEEIIGQKEIYRTNPEFLQGLLVGETIRTKDDMQMERIAMRTWAKIRKNSLSKDEGEST
jgi:spermidine/putrescine-binding protein